MDRSLSGRHLGAAPSHAAEGFPGRWLGLVGSMWLLACAGNSYNFAIYSSDFKSLLSLSQEQLATLGVAKDVGDNVGLLAGLLGDLLPAWAVICIGLCMNTMGYGGLAYILSHPQHKAAYWQVWLLLSMATNGACFFITAGLVTAQRNFPQSGGIVAGIVVGFIGLSGAIFAQLYDTFLAPNTAGFLWMLAVLPALVALASCFIVKPYPPPLFSVQKAVEEHCNLRMVLRCCLLLASFLLATILLQSVFPASQLLSSFSTGGMLFLLFLPALVLAPMAPHPGYSFLGSGRAATGAGRAKSSEHLPAIAEEDSGSEASSSTSRGRTQGTPPPEELRPAEREVPELAEAPQALPGAETAGPRPSLPGEAAEAEHTAGPSRFGRGLSMMAHGLGKSSLVGHVLKPSPFEEERRGMRHSRSLHTGVAQRRRWATADTGSFSQRLLRNQFLRQPQQQPQQLQHDLVGDANGLSREQSVADFGEHESYGVPEIVHGAGDPEEQGEAGGDWGFYFNEDDSSLRANRPFDFPPKSLSEALSWKLGAGALEGLEGDALEAGEGEPSVSGGLKEPLLAPSAHGGPRAAAPKRGPALGGDHTFGQALGTLDFWLMYAGLIAGFGSGLAAISNLAQIGESLGYNGNIQVFTSLLSVWQFLGRLASGSVSEYLTRSYGVPRPIVIACVQTLMVLGLLSFAFAVPGSLYIGSLVVGFTYGGLCSLMPVTAGELFGLKSLGMLYNTFLTAAPVGSFVLSGILVGRLYEYEADQSSPPTPLQHLHMQPNAPSGSMRRVLVQQGSGRQHDATLPEGFFSLSGTPIKQCSGSRCLSGSGPLQEAGKKCFGPQCFFLIFVILAVTASLGSLFHIVVAWRSRGLYASMAVEPDEEDAQAQDHGESGQGDNEIAS